METQEVIKQQVTDNPVVLYMKGTPEAPMCGFSAAAVQILEACGADNVATVNVLADDNIRQGVKDFSPRRPPSLVTTMARSWYP